MESLYRTYRPLTFESVVGQQHIVSTLEHAVTEGRLSHAYLFCGPRGTGKTTMARILAKALLCERAAAAREGGASGCMPDGTCPECQQIAEGTHPDVYELDAASRTGVDNVREEIIGSVNFAPVRGAYKIYIIDEVHMLTTAAFNALLKTLEEPPAHVVFVLCTTDPQKIPETILSRCQRFDFHRISNEDIVGRLSYICEQEGFDVEPEALEIVAKHARGGMRDALSTLEQLSVFGNGAVRVADARSLLGEVASSVLAEFCRAIAARDVPTLFSLVRNQVDEGNDLLELTRDLVAHVRDVYTARMVGPVPEVLDCSPEEAAGLVEEAGLFETGDRLARMLTVLDDAALEMRTAADTRLVLEIACTRLARPESDLTLEALAERLDRLEARIASGVPAAPLDAAGAAELMGATRASAAAATSGTAATSASMAQRPVAQHAAPQAAANRGGSVAPDMVKKPGGAAASAAPWQGTRPGGASQQGRVNAPQQAAPVPEEASKVAAGQGAAAGVSAGHDRTAERSAGHGGRPVELPADHSVAEVSHSTSASAEGVSGSHAAEAGSAAASGASAADRVEAAPARSASAARSDEGGAGSRRAASPAPVPSTPVSTPSAAKVAAAGAAATPAVTDAGELQRKWAEVVSRVTAAQASRGALLQSSRARSDDGDVLTVAFPAGSTFAIKMLGRADTQEVVLPIVSAVFGRRSVEYVMDGGGSKATAARATTPSRADATSASTSASGPAPSAPSPHGGTSASAAAPRPKAVPAPQVAPAAMPEPVHAAAPEPGVSAASPVVSSPAPAGAPQGQAASTVSTPAASAPHAAAPHAAAPWESAQETPAPQETDAAADQTSGPTIIADGRDVDADRRAWEEDQVPYDDAMIAGYEEEDLPPFDMPDLPSTSASSTQGVAPGGSTFGTTPAPADASQVASSTSSELAGVERPVAAAPSEVSPVASALTDMAAAKNISTAAEKVSPEASAQAAAAGGAAPAAGDSDVVSADVGSASSAGNASAASAGGVPFATSSPFANVSIDDTVPQTMEETKELLNSVFGAGVVLKGPADFPE
ncbi:DNA polymerase III subunit gamma/tau [Collinsella sp. An2]|uniref:DNA polymerase III subunit gamma/tau n=1 Tax=Collinsella sp. An2 TaxID=1965585 RepID=UPI000B396F4F|nr:DNA polymerase III subunit gamma/tau [Collinsella sp. An2]OUP10872.1 hypothetical protein B5F33_00315 [Collinsella sp. An2]